jgi:chorismate mutase
MTVDKSNDPAIEAGRERIDQLDAALISLLRLRREASAKVQSARTGRRGNKIDPKREEQITSRYEDAFGESGRDIASAILGVCRGRTGERA